MLLIAFLVLSYEGYVGLETDKTSNAYPFISLIIAASIVGWWGYCKSLQKRKIVPYYRFAIMLAGWGCFFIPNGKILVFIYLIAAILERLVKVSPEVAIDDHEILVSSFPKKNYGWKDLNNMVLKDGLLTIDLKSNKILQYEVNDEVSKELEKEFNDYCNERL